MSTIPAPFPKRFSEGSSPQFFLQTFHFQLKFGTASEVFLAELTFLFEISLEYYLFFSWYLLTRDHRIYTSNRSSKKSIKNWRIFAASSHHSCKLVNLVSKLFSLAPLRKIGPWRGFIIEEKWKVSWIRAAWSQSNNQLLTTFLSNRQSKKKKRVSKEVNIFRSKTPKQTMHAIQLKLKLAKRWNPTQ